MKKSFIFLMVSVFFAIMLSTYFSQTAFAGWIDGSSKWPYSTTITNMIKDKNGNVWAYGGTKLAKYSFTTNNWTTYPDAPFSITDVDASDSDVIITSVSNFAILKNGVWDTTSVKNPDITYGSYYASVAVDSNNTFCLLISHTTSSGSSNYYWKLYYYNGSSWVLDGQETDGDSLRDLQTIGTAKYATDRYYIYKYNSSTKEWDNVARYGPYTNDTGFFRCVDNMLYTYCDHNVSDGGSHDGIYIRIYNSNISLIKSIIYPAGTLNYRDIKDFDYCPETGAYLLSLDDRGMIANDPKTGNLEVIDPVSVTSVIHNGILFYSPGSDRIKVWCDVSVLAYTNSIYNGQSAAYWAYQAAQAQKPALPKLKVIENTSFEEIIDGEFGISEGIVAEVKDKTGTVVGSITATSTVGDEYTIVSGNITTPGIYNTTINDKKIILKVIPSPSIEEVATVTFG